MTVATDIVFPVVAGALCSWCQSGCPEMVIHEARPAVLSVATGTPSSGQTAKALGS